MAWKVPAQARPASRRADPAQMRATRRVISAAARRVKVSSRIRRGSAPRAISAATRWASVCVLPDARARHDQQGPVAVLDHRLLGGVERRRRRAAIPYTIQMFR